MPDPQLDAERRRHAARRAGRSEEESTMTTATRSLTEIAEELDARHDVHTHGLAADLRATRDEIAAELDSIDFSLRVNPLDGPRLTVAVDRLRALRSRVKLEGL